MDTATKTEGHAIPWNKGKLLGQKPPLKLIEIWAIRIRLQLTSRARELALFNLAIDSKLRGRSTIAIQSIPINHYGWCLVYPVRSPGTNGIKPFSYASSCNSVGAWRMSIISPLIYNIHTMGLSASRLGNVHSGESGPILSTSRISLDLFCPVLSAMPKNSYIAFGLQ